MTMTFFQSLNFSVNLNICCWSHFVICRATQGLTIRSGPKSRIQSQAQFKGHSSLEQEDGSSSQGSRGVLLSVDLSKQVLPLPSSEAQKKKKTLKKLASLPPTPYFINSYYKTSDKLM